MRQTVSIFAMCFIICSPANSYLSSMLSQNRSTKSNGDLFFHRAQTAHGIGYRNHRNADIGKNRRPKIGTAKQTEQHDQSLYTEGENNILAKLQRLYNE